MQRRRSPSALPVLPSTSFPATLFPSAPPAIKRVPLRAILYALWANCGEGELRNWLRES